MADLSGTVLVSIFTLWGLVFLFFGYKLGQLSKVQPIIDFILRKKDAAGDSQAGRAQAPNEQH